MDKIEKVKKITHKNCWVGNNICKTGQFKSICKTCEQDTIQICQLFEPKCNHFVAKKTGLCLRCGKQVLEPKPDEGSLLTDEDIDNIDIHCGENEVMQGKPNPHHYYEKELLEAQRDLTASIKDAECKKLLKDTMDLYTKTVQDECQARIEALIEEIGKLGLYEADSPPIEGVGYQFLGSYILKWGQEDKPSIAFKEFDCEALKATQYKGGEG